MNNHFDDAREDLEELQLQRELFSDSNKKIEDTYELSPVTMQDPPASPPVSEKSSDQELKESKEVFEELGRTVQPVDGKGLSIREKIKEGTWINRKIAYGLGLTFVLATTISFIFAYQSADRKYSQNQNDFSTTSTKSATIPDNVKNLPKAYGEPNKNPDNQKKPVLGPPNTTPITQSSVSVPQYPPVMVQKPYVKSSVDNELTNAMKSPLRFTSGSPVQTTMNNMQMPDYLQQPYQQTTQQTAPMSSQTQDNDPNAQTAKVKFFEKNRSSLSFYLNSTIEAPVSEYVVQAGTLIPGILISGINSDLPGNIVGQIRENVYDSVSGKYLLIPQGSKVIGEYDSTVTYGQERALIVWTRLIFPNGYSINLAGMGGTDLSGFAGLKGKVNNHTDKVIKGALISSILSAGVAMAGDTRRNSFEGYAASGAVEAISQAGARITEKNINIQPTLEIAPGTQFNIFVNKDILLVPYGRF